MGPSKEAPASKRSSIYLKPLKGLKEQREQRVVLERSLCYSVEDGGKTKPVTSCCNKPDAMNTAAHWSSKNVTRPQFKQYLVEANVNEFC